MKLEDINEENESELADTLKNLAQEFEMVYLEHESMPDYDSGGLLHSEHRVNNLLFGQTRNFRYSFGVNTWNDQGHVTVQIKDLTFFKAGEIFGKIMENNSRLVVGEDDITHGERANRISELDFAARDQSPFRCSDLLVTYYISHVDYESGSSKRKSVAQVYESDGGVQGRLPAVEEGDIIITPRSGKWYLTGDVRVDSRTHVMLRKEITLEDTCFFDLSFDSIESLVRSTYAKLEHYIQSE